MNDHPGHEVARLKVPLMVEGRPCPTMRITRVVTSSSTATPSALTLETLRRVAVRQSVPYPAHCLQPDKCAGLSHCPRDPTCID